MTERATSPPLSEVVAVGNKDRALGYAEHFGYRLFRPWDVMEHAELAYDVEGVVFEVQRSRVAFDEVVFGNSL